MGRVARPRRRRRDASPRRATTPAFGDPDEWLRARRRRPTSTAVAAAELDLWRDELLARPTDDKVALALELEAATRAADPRVRGVESAAYGDAAVEAAVANSLGVEASTRRTACSCSRVRDGRRGRRAPRPATASRRPHASPTSTSTQAARDAAERAVRLLGATPARVAAPPGGARPAGDAVAARRCSAARCQRRGDAEGPVDVRRAARARRSRRPGVTLVDDPTIAEAFGAATHDGEGVPDPPGRAHRRRAARAASCTTSTPAAAPARGTTGSAVRGGFKSTPGRRRARAAPASRARSAPRRSWRRCPRRSTCSR